IMFNKISRPCLSLFLALTMIAIAFNPQPAYAAGPWYVSTTGDDNNDCLSPGTACATINGAIGKANAGDTINVAVGTYTGSAPEVVLVDKDATLTGGWDQGFISENGNSIIDGEGVRRGITVNSVTAILERFTMQNGYFTASYNGGGGIYNTGTLTLSNSTV